MCSVVRSNNRSIQRSTETAFVQTFSIVNRWITENAKHSGDSHAHVRLSNRGGRGPSRHARVRDPTIETLRDQHAVRFLALKQLYSNKDSVSREAINLRVSASSACVAFAILIALFPRR
jgi:hypothetical protein